MRRPRLTPGAYRALTFAALLAVAFIIVSGAAVRLTGSGLGCSDWPTCEENRLVAPLELHPMVEFVNRLVTGLVSIAVILAVLGSLWRVPRRRDLVWLSLGLVAGVVGQIVLGGLTVLFDLKPPFVMGHFLLSILILGNALVLHHRAGQRALQLEPVVDASTRRIARVVFALTCAALFTGTVVTAAGPHGGDEEVERLSWPLPDVTRVHAAIVIALVAGVIVLLRRIWRAEQTGRLRTTVGFLLAALGVQATIGYMQYFNDVPALLVGFHVTGAVIVFSAVTHVQLALYRPAEARADAVSVAPEPALT